MARDMDGAGASEVGAATRSDRQTEGPAQQPSSWRDGLLGMVAQVLELPREVGRFALAAAGTWLVTLAVLVDLLLQGEAPASAAGQWAGAVVVLLPLLALGLLAAGTLRLQRQNLLLEARLREQGGVDLLTGVAGRDRFCTDVELEFMRFKRYDQPLSVVRLSVDFFNRLSAAYGDDVADQLLVRLADLLRAESRDTDRVGRLGEAEFAVLLPGVDSEGACQPAERICEAAARLIQPSDLGDLRFTVSVGVTHALARDRDGQAVLRRAKVALGAAVFAGRNRVALSDRVLLFPLRAGAPEYSPE